MHTTLTQKRMQTQMRRPSSAGAATGASSITNTNTGLSANSGMGVTMGATTGGAAATTLGGIGTLALGNGNSNGHSHGHGHGNGNGYGMSGRTLLVEKRGKLHHAFPRALAPYPVNYDQSVIDAYVYFLFCGFICSFVLPFSLFCRPAVFLALFSFLLPSSFLAFFRVSFFAHL
jgi:hypothetical protein